MGAEPGEEVQCCRLLHAQDNSSVFCVLLLGTLLWSHKDEAEATEFSAHAGRNLK